MKPIVLTRTEGDALDAIETDQIREPIALVRDAGLDPSYFFEFGRWSGGDFTRSDISGVSFRGANLHGAVFRPNQIPIVMATNPRRGPCDDIVRDEIEPEALAAFLEARRRIAIADAGGKDELSLSIVALDRLPPEIAVLSDVKILTLRGTNVEDISPLAGMTAMQRLDLSGTKADLSALTAKGAAWETDDRALSFLSFDGVPATVVGGPLADIAKKDQGKTSIVLEILRQARDAVSVEVAITYQEENSSVPIPLTANLEMICEDQLENIDQLESKLIGALNAEPQDIVDAYRTAVQQDPLDISELNARFSDVSELLEPFSIHRFSTELHRLTETHDELVFELKQLIDSATTS